VAEGLERSGRLVTGAAAIMVVVFAAFALADVSLIKALGLGLALAVVIDATIVRALVVPATMRPARPPQLVGAAAAGDPVSAAGIGRNRRWQPGPVGGYRRRPRLMGFGDQ